MMGSEYVIPLPFLKTALRKIMDVGKAKDHFDMLETQHSAWEMLPSKSREGASKRRMELNVKKDPNDMDCGMVGEGEHQYDQILLDSVGEGKGGKGGKGKGMSTVCYKCRHKGHDIAECNVPS